MSDEPQEVDGESYSRGRVYAIDPAGGDDVFVGWADADQFDFRPVGDPSEPPLEPFSIDLTLTRPSASVTFDAEVVYRWMRELAKPKPVAIIHPDRQDGMRERLAWSGYDVYTNPAVSLDSVTLIPAEYAHGQAAPVPMLPPWDWSPVVDAYRAAWRSAAPVLANIGREFGRWTQAMSDRVHDANPARWHANKGVKRRHCPRCIPAFARTKPLAIDGAALDRRRRARVRRKR